jgi:LytS/YehU family sensor histidine kinase
LINPLNIRVEVKGNLLEVSNNIQALLSPKSSAKTGLQNLNERMKILTGQPIIITEDEQFFKVQFALLNP